MQIIFIEMKYLMSFVKYDVTSCYACNKIEDLKDIIKIQYDDDIIEW